MNNATPHGVALFFDAINKKNPNMTIRILKRAANGARTRDPQLGKPHASKLHKANITN